MSGKLARNDSHQNKKYCYFPKFSDIRARANNIDPDHTTPRGAVLSGSALLVILSALFGNI